MNCIKEIVEGIIEVCNTRNVYEIIEYLDIRLIKKDLRKGLKGRFFRDMFGNEYIYVSTDLLEEEEKIVIAHELGHAILHTSLISSYYSENHLLNKGKIEYQANLFAAELLISDNIDIEISIYDSITIKELGCLLEVSERLIELKFRQDMDIDMVTEGVGEYK